MPRNSHQPALIELKNTYLRSRIHVDELQFQKGQHWHLLGANGAGKSSLLALVSGLILPDSGTITYKQKDINELPLVALAKVRAYLHQNQHCEFDIPARQLLSFYSTYDQLPDLLDEYLQVNQFLHKPASQLSGGQQQRFHIARCLAQVWPAVEQGEALLLLDEPIQQLDPKYQQSILHLLRILTCKGNTVISTCHDINLSYSFASHVALIYKQKIYASGPSYECMSIAKLNHIFEHEFVEVNTSEVAFTVETNDMDSKALHKQQKFFINASNSIL